MSEKHDALINAKRVAAIAGIHPQRLHYWEKTGLVSPAATRRISPRNVVRLYSLDGVLQVVVAAAVVSYPGVSLQHLRQILLKLMEIDGYSTPLTEVRFAIDGRHVYMQHEDGSWEDSRGRQGQLVERQLVVNMNEVRSRISSGLTRTPDQIGKMERRRGVHGSKPVFAGTRIPQSAVRSFIESGATDQQILDSYPNLTSEDIEAVRSSRTA